MRATWRRMVKNTPAIDTSNSPRVSSYRDPAPIPLRRRHATVRRKVTTLELLRARDRLRIKIERCTVAPSAAGQTEKVRSRYDIRIAARRDCATPRRFALIDGLSIDDLRSVIENGQKARPICTKLEPLSGLLFTRPLIDSTHSDGLRSRMMSQVKKALLPPCL